MASNYKIQSPKSLYTSLSTVQSSSQNDKITLNLNLRQINNSSMRRATNDEPLSSLGRVNSQNDLVNEQTIRQFTENAFKIQDMKNKIK